MHFGHYYRCHQEIIRITSLHLGGNRPTCTTYRTLNCDIPHNSYPYIAWVDEASEIKYLAQGHKHVGANRARTHNLPFMSPALFRWTTRALIMFTSPLELDAIFGNGITLRLELNGGSEIRDPVPARFKHVTVIVACTLLCCDWITYVQVLWNFQKADFEPYSYGKKYITFSFPIHVPLASDICLWDAPTCACIQLYT